ncbi:GNAT family N-acetyltransferase [Paenibacillus alkalitolerans]|uniref:GNAT family N-acetyltransferase n=1 Tax=Paenibacillus alkalitolerans TaxID=2799335 RepID=UPI0018F518AC|nr:GNAT family N-acetyltransferase [Paenibacillus alkalitolerans]
MRETLSEIPQKIGDESMIEVVDITSENIQEKGFFCMRSKPKSEGYQSKLTWLLNRFQDGLKLKVLEDNGHPKGFIEYIPIENSWRGVKGSNYLLIHCMWIVGKAKGKGYGSKLLLDCIEDAKLHNKSGVAMVASSQTWLADKDFFIKNGFESVEQAPPCFELIVKKFNDHQVIPKFNHGWEERASKYRDGITILKSDQCPYIHDAVETILEVAAERGINSKVIDIDNSNAAQFAASAYGTFNVIYNGKLLTYHPINKRELHKKLDQA